MDKEEETDYFKENRMSEIFRRVIKYIVMSIAFALSLYYVPSQKINTTEIIILTTIGTIIFAILDMYCPSVKNQ